MMTQEQTDHYTLRAETGWTGKDGKHIGWWVGYVERKDNVYFFATRLIKDRDTYNLKITQDDRANNKSAKLMQ